MNPQMDVLYMKDLGHVLATFTRAAEPDQLETSASVSVGDGLHLRGLGIPGNYNSADDYNVEDFVVAASHIALARFDLNPTQLAAPRDQVVTFQNNVPAALTAYPNPSPLITPSLGTPRSLTIKPSSVFGSDTKYLLLIYGQALASPIEWPATFPGNSPKAILTFPALASLASGTYYAVAFVPDNAIAIQFFKVP
jgi:hypothetical protein